MIADQLVFPPRHLAPARTVPRSGERLPSTSLITASSAPQTVAAFSAIVSITGWISVGELAITPKDFARRSLLFQSFSEFLEQPDILDGDNRLIGKRFYQFDLAGR